MYEYICPHCSERVEVSDKGISQKDLQRYYAVIRQHEEVCKGLHQKFIIIDKKGLLQKIGEK